MSESCTLYQFHTSVQYSELSGLAVVRHYVGDYWKKGKQSGKVLDLSCLQAPVEILGRDGSNPLRGEGDGFRLVRLGGWA